MPKSAAGLSLCASALMILAACSDVTPTVFPPVAAQLRVTHATPSLGAIDVLVNGSPVVTGLGYGNSSALVTTPGGSQDIVVRSGATTLGSVQFTLATNHLNSLLIVDSAPQFSTVVQPDTGQPIATKANIRLVNVAGSNGSAPTQLQALIHAPNANPDSVVTSNIDATIPTYWSLMYFDPGAFDIRYVAAGDTTTLAQVSFSVPAGEKRQVVLQRAANGSYSASVSVEP